MIGVAHRTLKVVTLYGFFWHEIPPPMASQPVSFRDFKELSIEETFKILQTSSEGLTETEAKKRLEKYEYKEVQEKKAKSLQGFPQTFLGSDALVAGIDHRPFLYSRSFPRGRHNSCFTHHKCCFRFHAFESFAESTGPIKEETSGESKGFA